MASNTRRQLETWLKTVEVNGSVLDVGGTFMPINSRTKTWNVDNYKIADRRESRNGIKADYVIDLNVPTILPEFDNVFCIEVMSHVFNPVVALENCNRFTKLGGNFFVSFHFLFPHHTNGFDCLRFTKSGAMKLLEVSGFEVVELVAKRAADKNSLLNFLFGESKVNLTGDEVGYLIRAKKVKNI